MSLVQSFLFSSLSNQTIAGAARYKIMPGHDYVITQIWRKLNDLIYQVLPDQVFAFSEQKQQKGQLQAMIIWLKLHLCTPSFETSSEIQMQELFVRLHAS